jgi:aminoglycoside phosphotransferase (APT) family kinase protein
MRAEALFRKASIVAIRYPQVSVASNTKAILAQAFRQQLMPLAPCTDTDIRWIAAKFGIECSHVSRIPGGFSGAMVLQVTSNDEHIFAIRATPDAIALPLLRRRSLHRLLASLHSQELTCVAVPLRVLNGLDSEIQLSGTIWQAEPWLPGQSTRPRPTPSQLTSALTTLSILYRRMKTIPWQDEWFRVAYEPSPGIQRRRQIVTHLIQSELTTLNAQVRLLGADYFRELALRSLDAISKWIPWLNQSLQTVEHHAFALQPVIRDLWRPHVLFTGDECTGLIDLTAASTDHPCLDLARLFRSWFGRDTATIRRAFQEFAGIHGLSSKDAQLFAALDAAAALLSPLTWIRRGLETTAPETGDAASTEPESVRHSPAALERLQELTELAEGFVPCESL